MPRVEGGTHLMPRVTDIADSALAKSLGDDFFDAFNSGREAEASAQGLVYGIWSAIMDSGTCDFCAWADGKIFGISETHIVPPAHFGCKCIVSYVDAEIVEEGELEDFDLWISPPEYVFPIGKKGK